MTPQNLDKNYIQWLSEIKEDIRKSQIKAAVTVNRQLVMLYWNLGKQITIMQAKAQWGDGFLERLSKDLTAEFPQMKGLSYDNLKKCRRFYQFYNQPVIIGEQVVPQLQVSPNKIRNNLFHNYKPTMTLYQRVSRHTH